MIPNMALHLTAKSAVSLRYSLLLAASELGVRYLYTLDLLLSFNKPPAIL